MPDTQADIDSLLAEAAGLATLAPPNAKPASHAPPATAPGPARELDRILRIEVPVIVKLAECEMPTSRVLALSPGSIIEFDKPAEAPLDLLVNNKKIGAGQAVKVGENFGLRVLSIGTLKEKIAALGGQ